MKTTDETRPKSEKSSCSEKIRYIFPLFLICCINSSLPSLKTTQKSAKNLHFLFLFRPFLFHLFSFNIFPYFLSSLFLWSLFPLILLFIPFCFSLLFLFSFLHSFFFSPSHVSLTSFLHRRFCVSSFCFTSLFFSFVLDLIFLFTLLLYFFFIIFVSVFFAKKILWSIFRDKILSLFFEPSLLRCFIACFSLLASSSFLVCSFLLLILSAS